MISAVDAKKPPQGGFFFTGLFFLWAIALLTQWRVTRRYS